MTSRAAALVLASRRILAAAGSLEASPDMLPAAFEGEFVWWHDADRQKVRLLLDRDSMSVQSGTVRASGVELYDVAGRWAAIEVTIRVHLASGCFELLQVPEPGDRAQESTAGDLLIGVISADLRTIIGTPTETDGYPVPDFVLRAAREFPNRHLRLARCVRACRTGDHLCTLDIRRGYSALPIRPGDWRTIARPSSPPAPVRSWRGASDRVGRAYQSSRTAAPCAF